ncbi:hypothetical protein GGR57DRAFT_323559 [Xylariaceae sp. FL1272]|nr:hypothetical protein GGR57DRAFT_323559 [Xylariaceae sp. FL1272]
MAPYPYAPPPPPPSSSTPTTAQYPSYGAQPAPYNSGGSHRGGAGGRGGRGHHQGPGHDNHNAARYYQQPQPPHDYTPSPPNAHFGGPPHGSQWQPPPPASHYPQHQPAAPHASSYPPAYGAPYTPQPGPGYQSQYPSAAPRPAHAPSYPPHPSEPPTQRWGEQGHAYASYPSRGGRGGYNADRGGHVKSDPAMGGPAPMRMGFDQNIDRAMHPSSAYGSPFQASTLPQPVPYSQPPYHYPPPESPYPPAHMSHNSRGYGMGGSGRDGFGHSHRGGRGGHGDRGGKFRNRDHKGHQGNNQNNQSQKPDNSAHANKKKKRKTNTLGLTPGDESSDGEAAIDDEEKRLADLLGADAPVIGDLAAWIAERKANFPTKARTEAKKAASAAANETAKEPAVKIDKDQAKIDKLERKLSKLKGSIEKRKRAANDEGDEMRADKSSSASDSSDDERPEAQSSKKSQSSTFLPPPPITRADPSNHCKYYSTGGTCGKKGKCRFKHDPQVREAALQERTKNGGRMTLKQRLLLNDKEHDDMDLVRAVMDMRTSGRLLDPSTQKQNQAQGQNAQTQSNGVDKEESEVPVVAVHSTLPSTAGVASLPPNPYANAKKAATAS